MSGMGSPDTAEDAGATYAALVTQIASDERARAALNAWLTHQVLSRMTDTGLPEGMTLAVDVRPVASLARCVTGAQEGLDATSGASG